MPRIEDLETTYQFPMAGIKGVLQTAEEEARKFNHKYIGTEHLLLGCLQNENPRLLASLGISADHIREQVEFFIMGKGEQAVEGEVDLNPRAKKVIELAVDEAKQLHDEMLESDHVMLGLVREGEGIAAKVVEALGINFGTARLTVLRYRRENHEITEPALNNLKRLQIFLEDPTQDVVRKQQINMILNGTLGLISPSPNQQNRQ